ncbi:MAG: Hsp20/alpha crystallin family protein [Candidatus Bathyarchaeum tardum]|nr:MAG: Hsp20/alpha crystallin family protein [Candidatus Bathyarchaeum tardum]
MNDKSKKKETVETPQPENNVSIQPLRETTISRGFDSIFEDFRKSFDDLMSPFLPMRTWMPDVTQNWPVRAALVDLVDNGDQFLVRAELPGFEKTDVEILTNKDTLTFRAEKKSQLEAKDKNYLHRERTYSSSKRTINFPEEVDPSKIVAKMNNGVLEIIAPKKEPEPDEKLRKIELK